MPTLQPLSRVRSSNVVLAKVTAGPVLRPDTLRPKRGSRRGVDPASGVIVTPSLAMLYHRQQRLLNTYKYDLDIFAMVRQVMRRLPPWQLTETTPDEGDAAHKALLDSFFHLPDGTNTCQQILRCTIARMKMLGKAHWVLRRLQEETALVGSTALELQRQVVHVLAKQLGVDAAEATAAVNDTFGANAPIGFELLLGAMQYNRKTKLWEQSTGQVGTSRTFPAGDVLEFNVLDPAGGTMSELERLEPWSDASVSVFKMNRDAVKTGGMADMLIVMYGTSKAEVERIEALMEDRADPARSEDSYLPMLAHATAPEGQRVGMEQVKLSEKGRDSRWLEFSKGLRVQKAGATGVPLQAVGEFELVTRANMETADIVLMEHEIKPWCEDFKGQVTEQLLVDVFGYLDWQFDFAQVDTRGQEFAHKQDMDDLQNGAITPYDYWTKTRGEQGADAMIEQLETMGVNGDAFKVPWQINGGKWGPVTEQVPAHLWDVQPAGMVPVGETPIPVPKTGVADATGLPLGDVAKTVLAPPGPAPVAGTPEAMTKVLDRWQAEATTALRKIGVAYDPAASAAAWSVLPGQMYLALDRALYGCASVAEVSMVFKDARDVLRVGTEKLEKVMAPQHVLRALTGAIDEVFLAREQDAAAVVAARLREDDAPFEVEAGAPPEGETAGPTPPLQRV